MASMTKKAIECAVIGCAEQSEAHRSRMMRLLSSAHPMCASYRVGTPQVYIRQPMGELTKPG